MQHSDQVAPLLLGIDTGGTFTDAVLVDDRVPPARVVAAAKSPTTHHDLSIGIRGAIDAVLGAIDPRTARIELVSLSTTLATNALVEGNGRRVCAVIIGFDEEILARDGLGDALGGDPVVFLPGGHDPHGTRRAELDLTHLEERILGVDPEVDAFAVMAQFSVRNPEHEEAAAALIRHLTGKAVTASHTLSARLNGPRRALTALLNARLVPIIDELVATTTGTLAERGVDAPLMVVRGDGSLVSADFVRERPIETILSGPAASLVGAAHLTGCTEAIISDIGGTTTDIAVLRDGVPVVSDEGATVGGHRTMVKAVAMHTHGLGGDSEVRHDDRAVGTVLRIGPRRVVPVSLLATEHPQLVHDTLDRQRRADAPSDLDGVFLLAGRAPHDRSRLSEAERGVLDALDAPVVPAAEVLTSAARRRVADRLAREGFVRFAAFTPTDANHVLGRQDTYDADAARSAAALFCRRRDRLGHPIATDVAELAAATVTELVRRSAEAVLAAAFVHDGRPATVVASPAVQWALDARLNASAAERSSAARVDVGVSLPIVALGASAATYYPSVAAACATTAIVPEHAGVANAVGAVVGRVRLERTVTVSSPQPGSFVAHTSAGPLASGTLAAARDLARATMERDLADEMARAGAPDHDLAASWHETVVEVSGQPMFVEGRLTLTASGRPQRC